MADAGFNGLVLIVSCVFLGWLTSVYVIEGRLNLGAPAIYGTHRWLLLARLGIWSGAIGVSAASMIVVSVLFPEVTFLAILFGAQAVLLDFCSRIRFLHRTSTGLSCSRIGARWPERP